MLNPFNPQQDPNEFSHLNVQTRLLHNVKAAKVNDQIFQIIQNAFEDALKRENIPLIRIEKKRLLVLIMKQVLTDMLTKLDDRSKS